jgi:phosphoserine aminotransferase
MQQTLQQVVDERISFLKEQINPQNKSEENKTFQLQIDAIRSAVAAAAIVDDDNNIEEVEAIIAEKKALLKKSEDVYEFDRLSAELEGLEWLQRQISRLVWG